MSHGFSLCRLSNERSSLQTVAGLARRGIVVVKSPARSEGERMGGPEIQRQGRAGYEIARKVWGEEG